MIELIILMRNSLSIRLLMIFALLFAQIGGLTHGISHLLTEQSQSGDQPPAHENYCDLCDAYAQTASAVASSIFSFTPFQNYGYVEQSRVYSFFSIASVPFSARAPPEQLQSIA